MCICDIYTVRTPVHVRICAPKCDSNTEYTYGYIHTYGVLQTSYTCDRYNYCISEQNFAFDACCWGYVHVIVIGLYHQR